MREPVNKDRVERFISNPPALLISSHHCLAGEIAHRLMRLMPSCGSFSFSGEQHGKNAYSQYNAHIRRLISFEQSLKARTSRMRKTEQAVL
jgi:hypothetical protein